MTKGKSAPRLVAVDSSGKTRQIKAEQLKIDFGENRQLILSFPTDTWGDLEIEAAAQHEDDVPVISTQAAACNVLNLKVDVQRIASVTDEAPPKGKTSPVFSLHVQKVLEPPEKTKAPKKHKIRRWAQAALKQSADVTIRLVGEEEGRALNRDYRHKDYATNVLTFVYDEQTEPLTGDLVLCVPVVLREAQEQGKKVDAHFAHLVVHGMLHLQGFDHDNGHDAEIMENTEREIMKTLGFADPYA